MVLKYNRDRVLEKGRDNSRHVARFFLWGGGGGGNSRNLSLSAVHYEIISN